MEYTVSKLAKLSGVSPRTLRYYDEISLLSPEFSTRNKYRIYGPEQVQRLQQILFYKAMGFPLDEISNILDAEGFDPLLALENHKKRLNSKKEQLEKLLFNIDQTIEELKGGHKMKDYEKFEGFKETMIKENEEKYGKEMREKYGDEIIDASNDKHRKLSKAGHEKATKLGIIIIEKLKEGYDKQIYEGPLAKEIFDLHKEWIMCYWTSYSAAAHKGLGDMYIQDERFKEYYDQEQEGLAQYLRDIIHIYALD